MEINKITSLNKKIVSVLRKGGFTPSMEFDQEKRPYFSLLSKKRYYSNTAYIDDLEEFKYSFYLYDYSNMDLMADTSDVEEILHSLEGDSDIFMVKTEQVDFGIVDDKDENHYKSKIIINIIL